MAFPLSSLKKCSLWLCEPLILVFQSCFDQGYLPPVWLQAFITPVLKKGDASDPFNWRPIALSCIMCKLMEFLIKEQLLSYLLNKNLISKQQHAFIIKHSTTSNLLECLYDWSIALDDGNSVHVIYIDFKRALDTYCVFKTPSQITMLRCLRQALGLDFSISAWSFAACCC